MRVIEDLLRFFISLVIVDLQLEFLGILTNAEFLSPYQFSGDTSLFFLFFLIEKTSLLSPLEPHLLLKD